MLRGKWLILGITALAVVGAVLVSAFLVTPKYIASAMLLVNLPQIGRSPARWRSC
ncbi:MAG: Wzz/FepE/Etk N-terminal domain-containing protein [Clostridia bacterium]|nr:Wzz/FepE/Etk N-terminal domain-containing protein [Clostridia bacterium]